MFEAMERHPSYGMLGFTRRCGGPSPLFGSSIQHKNTVCMTLKHGGISRALSNDYYYGKETIVEVEMSYSQFAEAIVAMNVGDGVPCTIKFTEKDGVIPEAPYTSKKEQFEQEFAEHLAEVKKDAADTILEVEKIFEKKSISKADRELILKKLAYLNTQIGANTEFVYNQFNEQMEKTTLEAKGEVEAFCQNKLNSIALAALAERQEDFKTLENPIDIE